MSVSVKVIKGLATSAILATILATSAQANTIQSDAYDTAASEAINNPGFSSVKVGITKSATKQEAFSGYVNATYGDFIGSVLYDKVNDDTSLNFYQISSKIAKSNFYDVNIGIGIIDEQFKESKRIVYPDETQMYHAKYVTLNKNKIFGVATAELSLLDLFQTDFYVKDARDFGMKMSSNLYTIPTNYGSINFKIYGDTNKINSKFYSNIGGGLELSF